MKKAIFTKPFDDKCPNEDLLKSLLDKEGYDQAKLKKAINILRKGKRGEGELSYYLMNTYAEILCLHNVKVKCGRQKSQIDFVVIETDCIWVLESKSLSGSTTVDEHGKVTREKGDTTRYPGIQAKIQANNLKSFLLEKGFITDDFEVKYRVVFTDRESDTLVKFNPRSELSEFVDLELISTLFEGEHEKILSLKEMQSISDALIIESKRHSDQFVKEYEFRTKARRKTTAKKGKMAKSVETPNRVIQLHSQNGKRYKKKDPLKEKIVTLAVLLAFLYIYMSILNGQSSAQKIQNSTIQPQAAAAASSMVQNETLDFSERANAKKVSTEFNEIDGVLLIPDNYSKEELLKLLDNYDLKYDYVKITVTTSKALFDHYTTGVTISSSDRIALENNYLIGEYEKNNCYEERDGYHKNRMQFRQLSGKFASFYGEYFEV